MWNKNANEPEPQQADPTPPTPAPSAPKQRTNGAQALIGSSLVVRGEVRGQEDLTVEGRIEGQIGCPGQRVVVGTNGRVQAGITAREVIVHGEVRGNIHGEEQVVVSPSGRLDGDIKSPSVSLENGCKFRGAIDMEPAKGAAAQPTKKAGVATAPKEKNRGANASGRPEAAAGTA